MRRGRARLGLGCAMLVAGYFGHSLGAEARERAAAPEVAQVTHERTLPDGRPLGGRVAVEEAPNALPALRAELPWLASATLYGWGSVRLLGHPRENELTVRAIVDAPHHTRRWTAACAVEVTMDGEPIAVRASYVGAPMRGGVYDAVRLELPIETLRTMAVARDVHGTICGDAFTLDAPQRATLAAFVLQFDRLARPEHDPEETHTEHGPREPMMPGEEDELWDETT